MTQATPAKDLIRYDLLVQEALKSVVRKVLVDAGRDGLPGEHHFYISFRTDYPGVRLSQRMRERYPDEMTIVLQHQFWDLGVTEHAFEVGLSFSGVPERLLIPFDALVGFFDPSVQFGLKFELQGETAAPVIEAPPPGPRALPKPADKPTERGPVVLRGAASEPAETAPAALSPAGRDSTADKPAKGKASKARDGDSADAPAPAAQVVSLDAFRKKP